MEDLKFLCQKYHLHILKGIYAFQQLDYLEREITGTRNLPMVFIDRQFIGGYDAFHHLKEIGKIQPGKTTCQYYSKENFPGEREE